nr:transporter substrate-binding domain-containing protein [Tissierella sp.]
MKSFKKILMLSLALTFVLVLGACDKNVSGLEEVQDRGELIYGIAEDNEPFNFEDENGDRVGFDIDIAEEVAERLGVDAKHVQAQEKVLSNLLASEYDVVVGSVDVTDESKARVDFTKPYYAEESEYAIAVVKSDQKFLDAIDQALETIVEDGTYAELTQKWFGEDLTAEIR